MISSKLPDMKLSIFAVMTKMANEYNAINLSQGFPDFQCSEELISLVEKYMRKGLNQYAPYEGVPALREIIAEKTEKLYQRKYHRDKEINITAGATQAIYTAISAFVKENDEVIVFEPAYDSYVPSIRINGGRPIFIQMKAPDYKIDWEEVKKAINPQTRMMIINSPHNPSATVLSEKDIDQLSRILQGTRIILLSDEVYEHITFDQTEHQSIAKYPKLADNALVISSFGKTFHTTGWKIGYILAPEKLMREYRKLHQYCVYSVNTPIQYAFADYLQNPDNYLPVADFYEKKRDYFVNLLKESKFKAIHSQGTYFQLLDYSAITQENDVDFAARMTKQFGVASIPVSVFYHQKTNQQILRFCFAKNNETLEKAAEKLMKIR